MSMAGGTSKAFLAAVRLVANGCQQAFEAAELPGLLQALTKARTLPFGESCRVSIQHTADVECNKH